MVAEVEVDNVYNIATVLATEWDANASTASCRDGPAGVHAAVCVAEGREEGLALF